MTGSLADFLLARIAEDVRRVDEIPDWHSTDSARGDGWGNRGAACPLCDHYMFDGSESATKDAWWDHMEVVHRRTRVLAECEAKRQIVVRYEFACDQAEAHKVNRSTDDGWEKIAGALELCVQSLALPHADHPGFREEWRP